MEQPDTRALPGSELVAGVLTGDVAADDERIAALPLAEFAAAVDAAREPARARAIDLGIDPGIVSATFGDIDRKTAAYGDDGIRSWILGLLRVDVVQLGRLQFERVAGPLGHAIHIPELGPLTPELVDDALSSARDALGSERFTCESWMLDPAIEDLPAYSNIRRFRHRFRIEDEPGERERAATGPEERERAETGPGDDGPGQDGPGSAPTEGDASVCKFVFRRPLDEVLAMPDTDARTSVERLVLERLHTGYHWREPLGTIGAE
jgi:hypothetical protein